MRGQGELARLLAQRFKKACDRLGFNDDRMMRNRALDTTRFRVPARNGQLSLFDDGPRSTTHDPRSTNIEGP